MPHTMEEGTLAVVYEARMLVLFLIVLVSGVQRTYCEYRALSLSGKPTEQSTTYDSSNAASKAIDGNIGTFTHSTVTDPHPWWRVDLQTEHCLGKITITIRKDCCAYRAIATVARAGLSSHYADNKRCGSPITAAQSKVGATVSFLCEIPRLARYVSFDIDPSSPGVSEAFLQIAEVAVEERIIKTCADCGMETPDEYNYHYESSNIDPSRYEFSVKARHDAHIALSPQPADDTNMYEIVIGGWTNSKSVIRRKKNGPSLSVYKENGIVSGEKFRGFWISYDVTTGYLAVGKEGDQKPFMTWVDPDPIPVKYVGFSTGWGSTGTFRYPCAVELRTAVFDRLPKTILRGNPSPLSTRAAKSVFRCADYCTKHAECSSFEYAKSSNQCHLYNIKPNGENTTPDEDTAVYALAK